MTRFRVYMVTGAETVVEVEAETGDEAVEKAFDADLPYAPGFSGFSLGDWTVPSELYPQWAKPEDDYEEIHD